MAFLMPSPGDSKFILHSTKFFMLHFTQVPTSEEASLFNECVALISNFKIKLNEKWLWGDLHLCHDVLKGCSDDECALLKRLVVLDRRVCDYCYTLVVSYLPSFRIKICHFFALIYSNFVETIKMHFCFSLYEQKYNRTVICLVRE